MLHCETPHTTHRYIQIWLNRGAAGYVLGRQYDLPKGSGPLSLADMSKFFSHVFQSRVMRLITPDRDGTIDIIFPVCNRHSTTSGIGTDCSITIAYNQQVPLCSGESSTLSSDGRLKCRGWGGLCDVDEGFEFSFDSDSKVGHFSSAVTAPTLTMH